MAAAGSAHGVETPRFTQMISQLDLSQALMRSLPPSASVTRQFITSCEALKLKRNNCKSRLEREWDLPDHRKAAREALIDYYYQLANPPLSTFTLSSLGLKFHWRDSISRVSRGIKDKSGVLELCNIVYNVGAAAAGLGSDTLKLSSRPERLPTAKKCFEEAAGAFAEVRRLLQDDDAQRWREPNKNVNLELQPQALEALIQCMLAYATRCFYEKAYEAQSKPKLLAQLAVKVLHQYRAAAGCMHEAVLAKNGLDVWLSNWQQYLDLESSYFTAQARQHAADAEEAACNPAIQRLHLQECQALMDRVYAASNSSKGGGKLLKLHRPDLLRLVTHIKTKLTTLNKEINAMVYGHVEAADAAAAILPEPARINVEPRPFKDAVKDVVEPSGAARPPLPLLFQGVVFDTSGARRAAGGGGVDVSDSSSSDDDSAQSRNALDADEDDARGSGWAQPRVGVAEPLPPSAPHATSCPSPRLPHHLAAARVPAVQDVQHAGGNWAGVRDSRVVRESAVRSSINVKGGVVDDDTDDPAASSEQILRHAREAREEQERREREEQERRSNEARRRQEDWQREADRRQEMLARDRPRPEPASPPAGLLSEAVEASVEHSLSPDARAQEEAEGRSGAGQQLPASREPREPPATPAPADTRRRALEAAERRQREAATAAAVDSGSGGAAVGSAAAALQAGGGSAAAMAPSDGGLYNGLRPGDVAAPGYLFGGLHQGVPFYVCQATRVSIWELPPAEHLVAVARTRGTHGSASQLRPGDPVPGHAGFLFGGYSNGLPFYHNEHTLQSVWELPRASPAPRVSNAPEGAGFALEEEVPSDDDTSARPAGAAAEEMSGEGEVEAALAARRRPHVDWAGQQAAPVSQRGGGRRQAGTAAQAQEAAQTQEELDAAMASRLQAEFEAEAEAAAEARDVEAEATRLAQAEHERELRVQQEEQTALEEQLRRAAAGRHNAEEAAARRTEDRGDAVLRQRHAEEERRAMELLQKEERLRSKERELERKAKELEEKERTAARKREKEKELERAQKEREAKEREAQQQASAAAGASRGTAESDEIPNEYLCPITLNIMTDPVIAMDGHTYDRVGISNWLKKSQKSPKTNALLPSKQLLPNHALKSMIIEWLERHPHHRD